MRTLLVAILGLVVVLPGMASAGSIDWVTVDDPGNAPDWTGYGAVASVYWISKYEITNAQYAEFLNAIAATDTNDLYSTEMGSGRGGITQSGSSGNYAYSPITGRESMPVNYVSFWDSLRFANWLHNGRPTGAQDSTTTEDGAYDMSLTYPSIVRKVGAKVFLTSEDEWYKAAYYDPVSDTYFAYPAGTDVQTTCAMPGATANTANCNWVVSDLTDVGDYTSSPSPNGTFDQGGNVSEWIESGNGTDRGLRGGNLFRDPTSLAVSYRIEALAWNEYPQAGFRVAGVPEPSNWLLLAAGLGCLGVLYRVRGR